MTTWADITSAVKPVLGRGDSLDSRLPEFWRSALSMIERRHTFAYMRHYNQFKLDPNSQYPKTISLNGFGVKSIESINIETSAGLRYPLVQVPAGRFESAAYGRPDQYYRTAGTMLILDKTPDEDYDVHIDWVEYSSPDVSDASEHELFSIFFDGVKSAMLYHAGLSLRDDATAARHAAYFEEAYRTLVMADEEDQGANAPFVMGD